MTTEITTTERAPLTLNESNFELAQRQAKAMSMSTFVPEAYKGDIANCLIALEIAHRIGASPLMVAQNLHIIHGRPSWSSQFIIAALNSCGRFSPLRFKMTEDGCVAWATDKEGEVLEGPEVTMEMAKVEGWSTKNGSKWKTMPALMLRYRAAAFFGRLYAPDVLMGMHTVDEVEDFAPQRQMRGPSTSSVAQIVNEAVAATVVKPEADGSGEAEDAPESPPEADPEPSEQPEPEAEEAAPEAATAPADPKAECF